MIDRLGGREFKLLLKPDVLAGESDGAAAKQFEERLVQLVSHILGERKNGDRRCQGEFEKDERRIVHFWDDAENTLAARDFLVRTRKDADADWRPDDKRELTLKYRTEDLVLAALAHPMLADGNDDTKFEEDIAPLQIVDRLEGSPDRVVRPRSPAMRSRFSVSRKTELSKAGSFDTGDLQRLIPGLDRCYRMATGTDLDGKTDLRRGQTVREQTFGGVKIQLGDETAAECCLTVWDFPERAAAAARDDRALPPARIVELSYKALLEKEPWSEDAARRATELFLGLQKSMPSNLPFTSKTEFALPHAP